MPSSAPSPNAHDARSHTFAPQAKGWTSGHLLSEYEESDPHSLDSPSKLLTRRPRARSPGLHNRDTELRALSWPEEPLETAPVETYDHLAVHRDHRNGHPAGLGGQLVASSRILRHILRREDNPARRKELFRRVTGLSGRRPVDRDLTIRHVQAPTRRPPKTRAPSLKPSPTVVPAPSVAGFASRHSLRCSSDRKKLMVVQ